MKKLLHAIVAMGIFACSPTFSATPTIDIDHLSSGGLIQSTDNIPVNRAGVTMKTRVGSMATQGGDNVLITGGSIDSTIVGFNNQSDGYFERLSANTSITTQGYLHANTVETNGTVYIGGEFVDTNFLYIENKGTFTANGSTAVTVSNTNVHANSVILITIKTLGGTQGAQPTVTAKVDGTSFTIKATAGDTSVYNYAIIN